MPSHGAFHAADIETVHAHHIYKGWPEGRRTRPPVRNGGQPAQPIMRKHATRGYAVEFWTPAFPYPVQDACGLRDGKRRSRKGAASSAAHSEQSHGRAARGGSSPPNARQLRSATDCGRKCEPDLCPRIEWQPGPPSRTLHPGHGSEISEPLQTETPPAIVGRSNCWSDAS